MTRAIGLVAGAVLFAALATANSGGYRYGVSDQAFYATAVVKALRPEAFPRDTPLIDAQARMMLADEAVAAVARITGADLPAVHFGFYALTLVALFTAAIALGGALRFSGWAIAVLVVLLTFRHQITRTGANTLEGYMHTRQFAFALGLLACAAFASSRRWLTIIWLVLAAVLHTTTALWFGLALAVAAVVAAPVSRRWLVGGAVGGAAVALWAVTLGPLSGRLIAMDQAWLDVLTEKTYLFPARWPLYAWAINLAYPAVIWAVWRRRRRLNVATPHETALVTGLLALVVVFLVSVPLTAVPVALAVQLQVNRVFWLLDAFALAYLSWWMMDRRSHITPDFSRVRIVVLAILAIASAVRGGYVLNAAGRSFVQVALPATAWVDAMTWLKSQPPDLHVFADPGHAWRYGVSVRLAAERDVLLESGKDTALAIYDRAIAMRVAERGAALAGFAELTTAGVKALAQKYALDVLVVETTRPFELPVRYRNQQFVIYDLR